MMGNEGISVADALALRGNGYYGGGGGGNSGRLYHRSYLRRAEHHPLYQAG